MAHDNLLCLVANTRRQPSDSAVTTFLTERADQDQLYTWLGSDIVALNVHKQYSDKDSLHEQANPPDAYHFARQCYLLARQSSASQTIIYDGISGSGKSHNAALVTKSLTQLGQSPTNIATCHQAEAFQSLVASLLQAKNSPMCNSASQAAHLFEMHYSPKGHLLGSKCLYFAFKKQRVTRYSGSERTFNVFYELLAGTTLKEKQEYGLRDMPSDYLLLSKSSSTLVNQNVQDERIRSKDRLAFTDLKKALAAFSISKKTMTSYFRLLSAILNLSNITFEVGGEDGQTTCLSYQSQADLDIVSALLAIPPEEVEQLLLTKSKFIKRDVVSVILTVEQAEQQRDHLCQFLYSLLVAEIFEVANTNGCPSESEIASNQKEGGFSILQLEMPGFFSHTASKPGQRRSTLIENMSSDGFPELKVNFLQELQQYWLMNLNFEETRGQNLRAKEEGIKLTPVEVMDRNSGKVELLRGGLLGGKSDTRPGGLVGGLHAICSDIKKGKIDTQNSDRLFLEQLRSSCTMYPGFLADAGQGVASSKFGIQHYFSTVPYDSNGFVDENLDVADVGFITLLKLSDDECISGLAFSPALVIEGHPKDSSAPITCLVSDIPQNRISKITTVAKQSSKFDSPSLGVIPNMTSLNAFLSCLFPFLDKTTVHTMFCLRGSTSDDHAGSTDFNLIKYQVSSVYMSQLVVRRSMNYVVDFALPDIAQMCLQSEATANTLLVSFSNRGLVDAKDFAFGRSRVFFTYNAFLSLNLDKSQSAATLLAQNIPGGQDRSSFTSSVSQVKPLERVAASTQVATQRRPASSAGDFIRMHRKEERQAESSQSSSNADPSGEQELYRSENLVTSTHNSPPLHSSMPLIQDDYFGATTRRSSCTLTDTKSPDWRKREKEANVEPSEEKRSKARSKRKEKKKPVKFVSEEDEEGLSKARFVWLAIVYLMTFWVPIFVLRLRKKYRRADVRLAFREKLACCFLIFALCAVVVFYIVFFGLIICPEYNYVWNVKELRYHQGKNDFFVAIRGEIYDITDFWQSQHSDISAQPVEKEDMLALAGQDLTNYFPIPLSAACPNLVQNENLALRYRYFAPIVDVAVHTSGKLQPSPNTDLNSPRWYYSNLVPAMRKYHKGPLVHSRSNISKLANDEESLRIWSIYDRGVYDLTDYFYTIEANPDAQMYQFLDEEIVTLFQGRAGTDVTEKVEELDSIDPQRKSDTLNCIQTLFFVGHLDPREEPRCLIQPYLLLAFSGLIVFVILIKFLAALQFGTKRIPEAIDKFVILQVPCYTEGEESLRKTINSLASLRYENTRKLLFVICDGQLIGAGNEKPTPTIVLDILGASNTDADTAEPLLYHAIGEGSKQLNYGKVYCGVYEYEGSVLPYVVVVKVGKPSERSKPGNRGKRDSQVLLMRFLNRVHFDTPMAPLELEIYHAIKNVIGVDPSAYSYMLCLDADTECDPDALNRLTAIAQDDTRIIGLAGETSITNDQGSWVSLIQNYEYFIAQNMAKAFESLFSSVTCLPGCFTLYRIKSHEERKPLLIANKILDSYADNNINTLHKKNLFLLGEDRFLTTLLLSNFPEYKTKFTTEAKAKTVVPDTWTVLLSQRRRWINSTVHNLIELLGASNLCGACCFSMRFIVLIDLVGTIILPATFVYLVYLIVQVALNKASMPIFSLVMLGAVYGLQAILFILKRQFQFVFWLLIYLLAYPIYSFLLPLYSFWHFDDVDWGRTRVVQTEGRKKKTFVVEEEAFDKSAIPLRRFSEYQSQAFEQDQEEGAAQYAEYNQTDRGSYQPSFRPSSSLSMTRSASSQLFQHSPSATPFGHGPLYTPFGSISAIPSTSLAMPMPSMPYSTWGPPAFVGTPPSMIGSHRGSIQAVSMDHGRPSSRISLAPSMMPLSHGHGRNGSFGSQSHLSIGNPFSPMPLASPSLSTDPSDLELKEQVHLFLSTQDLMTATKRSTREAIQKQFPKADLSSRKEFLNATIDAFCTA